MKPPNIFLKKVLFLFGGMKIISIFAPKLNNKINSDMITKETREIEKARALLSSKGYQTHNLWHIADVKSKFNCSDDEAMDILISALENEATMEQIWLAIDMYGEEKNLKKVDE